MSNAYVNSAPTYVDEGVLTLTTDHKRIRKSETQTIAYTGDKKPTSNEDAEFSKNAADEELMELIQYKKIEALEELYNRHQGLAMAVAYRILEDRNHAEDVLQEAFLAVWRQASSFNQDRGTARSWILSIVRHRAIDVTRGRAYSNERISLEQIVQEPRCPDAWIYVGRELERGRIRQAVENLPVSQKEAIILSYFNGYTQAEISEITKVPLGTVKGRLRLAMQKLRSLLLEAEEFSFVS